MAWMLVNKCQAASGRSYQQARLPRQYPKDAPANHVPVEVHGDRNCLFRAASVSVFGHEDAYSDIRKKLPSELHWYVPR